MGWAAVDTLVGLTKENVDAAHIVENNWEATAIDAPVANAMLNIDANLVGFVW